MTHTAFLSKAEAVASLVEVPDDNDIIAVVVVRRTAAHVISRNASLPFGEEVARVLRDGLLGGDADDDDDVPSWITDAIDLLAKAEESDQ